MTCFMDDLPRLKCFNKSLLSLHVGLTLCLLPLHPKMDMKQALLPYHTAGLTKLCKLAYVWESVPKVQIYQGHHTAGQSSDCWHLKLESG